jgi:hypothetical protein
MANPYYNPAKLTEARERKGLTKQQVADALNRPWMAVHRSEMGVETSPRALAQLCALYGIPLSDVLDSATVAA